MSAITGIGDSRTIVLGDAADLVHRRRQVGGLGLCHRLDRDRSAAADRHGAHVDLAR
jgi:hypothetical protein